MGTPRVSRWPRISGSRLMPSYSRSRSGQTESLWSSRRKASENLGEYFLAGRKVRGWRAGLSMAATQYAADTPLLASHPAYNYVARRYGWNIKNLDLDPQQMPDNESLDEIRTLLKEHPARFILWESAPDPAIAARLEAELELTSVVFSPCELHSAADRDAGLDYLSVMRQNIQNLAQVFGAKVSRTSAAE